jgi:peptidoglycan/LPS O-acetylase OafA/YrhL
MSPAPETEHLAFIDALRGWAFLSVLLVHVQTIVTLPRRVGQLAGPANYGVQFFFVISALTLFMSYEARSSLDRRPLAAFFIRRLFRIAPLFWLAIPTYLAFLGTGPRESAPNGVHAGQILATFFFVHGWYPTSINSVVPGGWSIAVEMTFYLIVPLCFTVLKTLRASVVASLLTFGCSIAISVSAKRLLTGSFPENLLGRFTYYWFPRQIAVFFLGFVLFFLIRRFRGSSDVQMRSRRRLFQVIPEISLLIIFAMSLVSDRLPVAYFWFSAAFALLAFGLSFRPVWLLVNPLTRYVGKVSFSAYITHFMIIESVGRWTLTALGTPAGGGAHGIVTFAIVYVVCGIATVLASSLTYTMIEVPGQDMGKSLIRLLRYGRARPLVPSRSPSVER